MVAPPHTCNTCNTPYTNLGTTVKVYSLGLTSPGKAPLPPCLLRGFSSQSSKNLSLSAGKISIFPVALNMQKIANSVIWNVHLQLAKYFCFPGATVRDIMDKIPSLIDKYPTATQVVIHVGTNDIKRQQSKLLKHDFISVFNLLESYHAKWVFISGPISTLGHGISQFFRLFSLHIWLQKQSSTHGLFYIDNFNVFWECSVYFSKDGLYPNRLGSRMLTGNIVHSVSVSYQEWLISRNICACSGSDVINSPSSTTSRPDSLYRYEQTETCRNTDNVKRQRDAFTNFNFLSTRDFYHFSEIYDQNYSESCIITYITIFSHPKTWMPCPRSWAYGAVSNNLIYIKYQYFEIADKLIHTATTVNMVLFNFRAFKQIKSKHTVLTNS